MTDTNQSETLSDPAMGILFWIFAASVLWLAIILAVILP